MEVIQLTMEEISSRNFPETALAIGSFDGVHIGHQKVISTAKDFAGENGWKSAVLTFHPSPKEVLGISKDVNYLTLIDDKIRLVKSLGIDYLYIVPFTKEFSKLSPEQFIEDYIIRLNVKHLVAGFDYTYGRFGNGNMDTMKIHSKNRFDITVIEKISLNNEKISSSLIRSLIKSGKTDEVPALLGRYYTTTGTVVHGNKIGRTIGFPTANIDQDTSYVLPKDGIYAVQFFVKEKWHRGVLNIGFRPTFEQKEKKRYIEVYIIDFQDEIYGESVKIEWHRRLRDEIKFSSVDELVKQMHLDTEETIRYFEASTD